MQNPITIVGLSFPFKRKATPTENGAQMTLHGLQNNTLDVLHGFAKELFASG